MFLATSNKAKRLLYLSYIQRTNAAELQRDFENVKTLLAELPPGFFVLVDLSQLEAMNLDCVPELGRMMELIDQAGVGLVVRVIPDPQKDIGMNILSIFHYPHPSRVVVCENMGEAIRRLSP